jgi:hypothetical protein
VTVYVQRILARRRHWISFAHDFGVDRGIEEGDDDGVVHFFDMFGAGEFLAEGYQSDGNGTVEQYTGRVIRTQEWWLPQKV